MKKWTFNNKLKFGDRIISDDHPAIIIAEIGINHNGSFDLCKEMVKQAAKSGADAIKLQTINAKENYVKGTESYNLFSKYELSKEETSKIFDYARKLNVEPLTTAGDF